MDTTSLSIAISLLLVCCAWGDTDHISGGVVAREQRETRETKRRENILAAISPHGVEALTVRYHTIFVVIIKLIQPYMYVLDVGSFWTDLSA